MQQTEKLKLNLIETGDPLSPIPLNENTQALDGLVAGIAAEQHLFKLAEAVIMGQPAPLSFDLTKLDVERYDALLLAFRLPNYSGSQILRLNDGSGMGVLSGSSGSGTPNFLNGVGIALFMPVGDIVIGMSHGRGAFIGHYASVARTGGERYDFPWQDIQSLTFTDDCPVNSSAILFGVRF